MAAWRHTACRACMVPMLDTRVSSMNTTRRSAAADLSATSQAETSVTELFVGGAFRAFRKGDLLSKEEPKLAYSVANFAKAVDLSESVIREELKAERLVSVYPRPGKQIINAEDGKRWLDSLPTEKPSR